MTVLIESAIDAMWSQIETVSYITREQFVGGLDGWEIEPVVINGDLAFAALSRGSEFHFASFGTGAKITRSMINERLKRICDQHGFVITKTPRIGADRQHRFNLAFAFRLCGEDEHFIHYRL